jgi:glycosyltransferase involved in cell wall biosynthesis
MKILLVVTGYPSINEPARSVFNKVHANALILHGCEVEVLYLRSLHPKRKLFFTESIDNITVHHCSLILPFVSKKIKNVFTTSILKRLVKKISFKPQVVQCIGGNAAIAGHHISKATNQPYCIHYIGGDLNEDIIHLSTLDAYNKSVLSAAFNGFESKALEQIFDGYYNQKLLKATVYRGIDLAHYSYCFEKTNTINFLFLGGMPGNTDLKGGFTLLEALNELAIHPIQTKLKFFVGGPEFNLNALSKNVANNKNIEIVDIGVLQKSQVLAYFKQSHVVLIPSLSEGLPNVMWEAMATGNMIIETKVGGMPEIIKNNFSGKLIEPKNPIMLKNAILEIVEDLPTIEEFAKNAFNEVQKFNYSFFIKQYLEIYQSILLKNQEPS